MKRIGRVMFYILLCLLLVGGLVAVLIRYAPVQDYLAKRTVALLSYQLGTTVSISHFDWNLFKDIDLRDFYLADKRGDTLLYAHSLTAQISYWSIWHNSINLKTVKLDGALVNLYTDSNGKNNLSELFASPDKVTSSAPSNDKPFAWQIGLKRLELTHTKFKIRDDQAANSVSVQVTDCSLNLHELALQQHKIDIANIAINGVDVRVTNIPTAPTANDTTSKPVHFLPAGWMIRWDNLGLTHATFGYHIPSTTAPKVTTGRINFADLGVKDIRLLTGKGLAIGDTIQLQIADLHAVEQSGFVLEKLSTSARISNQQILFDSLNLLTPHSHIQNYLSFDYRDFRDFNQFLNKVSIHSQLRDTRVLLSDLNYFFPGLEPVMHNVVQISGDIKGPISDLHLKKISIELGQHTILKGNFFAQGLPHLQETFLNLRVDQLVTDVYDLQRIYPTATLPSNLSTLGTIRFHGDFDGFPSDFVTRGALITDNGSANTDLNFKYNVQTGKSAYSGNLALTEFDLGKWFNDPKTFGKVSLSTKVNGSGIKLETLNATLDGQVAEMRLMGYDYKGLIINGNVKGKYFSGQFGIKDPNLDAEFKGTVDIGQAVPEFHFATTLRRADLYALHLTPNPMQLNGTFNANFKGKRPDDLVGSFDVQHLHIQRGKFGADINKTQVDASLLPDGQKQISLRSDNIDADIKGKFSFQELPKAIRNYINYTVTKNFEDTASIAPQQFTFDIKLYDSSTVWQLIDTNIRMVRNSTIKGELNSQRHIFNITASIPELTYSNIRLKRFNLDGKSQEGKLDATVSVDKVYMADSLLIDTFATHSYSEGDEFRFDMLVADAHEYNRAALTAYLTPLKGSVDMRFLPSEVWLGGNRWAFAPGNKIHIKNKQITSENLIFGHEDQSIKVDAYLKNDTSTSLRLSLNETSLGDFMNIFSKQQAREIKAVINGHAIIEDVFAKPSIQADIEARDVTLGNIPLGNLKVKSILDESQKKLNISGLLLSDKSNVAVAGYYSLDKRELRVNADMGAVDLNFLNYPLFNRYVKNVKGTVKGKVNVSGPLDALNYTGTVRINNAVMTVSYLNTQYTLNDEDIELRDGYIDVGAVDIVDRFNHIAKGTGRIYHHHFKDIELDLHVNATNTEMLNTTALDLPIFYGNAFAKGTIDFTGIVPAVNIRAYASVNKNTHCYIPISSSYETNKYSFYRFIDSRADTIKTKVREIRPTGINFVLDLDVNPDGVIDIILDPSSGDVLTSSGRGNLKIEVLRTGEFNIYGQYEIDHGSYLFTLQNIINKRFELDKGGTITFNGDAYKAVLQANAVYQVRTSTYDLINELISPTDKESQQRAKNRIVTDLLLKLKGPLQNPEVAFDIRPIDPDPLIRTLVDNKVQIIRNNETELNKQVFGLLVMNRFLPTSTSLFGNDISNGKSISGNVANTMSEFLSSQLSLYLSNFFDNINVKDFDVNLNFKQYDQVDLANADNNFNTRRELQLALTKRFFSNRLSINVGGNVDFGSNTVTQNSTKNTYYTGDFQIEYNLDKSGVWRAKAFNKYDYDNFNQRNRNRTGLGLSFRKDFDNWGDLFKRRPRSPKPEPIKQSGKKEEPLSPKQD
jgi:TamB, inner membrane protein subunit of TAM complex